MDAERDHLQHFVFPQLAERLRARRHDLVPIDLRWGVETISVSEEEAKELLVVKVCLGEIERSRPFFIGLLGDRYGWVPSQDRMQTAAREAGLETDVVGKSVTALEIEYGVFASPDQRRRSFFYLRDPLPYDEMARVTAGLFSDAHAPDPRGSERAARLAALKARLEREYPERVRHYRADWDATRNSVRDLDAFGQLVVNDLWRELEDETSAFVMSEPASWQDRERAAIEEFVHESSRDFVGRERLIAEVTDFATHEKEAEWAACVVGKPGTGKSALFAKLCRRIREQSDVLVLTHSAGVSIRSSSVDALLRRWVEELAAHLGVPDPADESQDIMQTFAELLDRTSRGLRVVILLDALDQFEPTSSARHLTWLPEPWPGNVRLIATSQPGAAADAFAKRAGTRTISLEPLTERETSKVVANICGRYHRAVTDDAIEALVTKQSDNDYPAAGNPLWLQLALEELLLLDADDFARLGMFTGTPEVQLHSLLLDTANSFSADLPTLYGTLLDRAEKFYGQRWASCFVELLTLSRAGLRVSDFRALLPRLTAEPWQELRFAALRRGLRAHIVQRGLLGQWDFSHSQAREAVLQRSLPDAASRRSLHHAIADHLTGLQADDPVRESELMHHLIEADDRAGAAEHYAGELSESEAEAATQALAAQILGASDQQPNPAVRWACSLLDRELFQDPLLQRLSRRYNGDLLRALAYNASIDDQIELATAVKRALTGMFRSVGHDIQVARDLSVSYNKLGDLQRRQGNLDAALDAYEQGLTLRQELFRLVQLINDPDTHELAADDLAFSHKRLGDLHVQRGEHDAAERAYEEARALDEERYRWGPDDAQAAEDLARSHARVGRLHLERGEIEAAERAFREALTQAKQLHVRKPDDVEAARLLWGSQIELGDVHRAIDKPRQASDSSPGVSADASDGRNEDLIAAQRAYHEALALARDLYQQNPEDGKSARALSISHSRLGELFLEVENVDGAQRQHEQALALSEELYQREPEDVQAARDLLIDYDRLAHLHRRRGNINAALRAYELALSLAEDLHRRMPERPTAARDVVGCLEKLALLCESMNETKASQHYWNRCHETLRAIRDAGMRLDPELAQLLEQLEARRRHVRHGKRRWLRRSSDRPGDQH